MGVIFDVKGGFIIAFKNKSAATFHFWNIAADVYASFLLSVAFGAVVRFAKHLTVADVGCSATAPRSNVVGIHFFELPNFVFVIGVR